MIINLTTEDLKQMTESEGLIIQGCGGDLNEWISGINDIFTENGILLDGETLNDVYVFEHEGLKNLLFSMENVKLNIGRLAAWRLQTHGSLGGTWLSDYLENKFGINSNINLDTPEETASLSAAFENQPNPNRRELYEDRTSDPSSNGIAVNRPIQAYIENIYDKSYGGFTMPLPNTPETFQIFFEHLDITG